MPIRFVSLTLCLALSLPSAAVQAQASAPPASRAPAAPLPTLVDPAARALFTQMVDAQKGLRSFAITVDEAAQGGTGAASSPPQTIRIAFAAPARASLTLVQQGKTLGQFLSDGRVFTRVYPPRKAYRRDNLPAAQAAAIVSTEVGKFGLLPHAYADPGGLTGLLNAPGLVAVARGAIAGPVNGVSVDSVVARLVGSDLSQATFTFVMGQGDHLLRQVIEHETVPANKASPARDISQTETIAALQVNPSLPAAAFAYTPGRGFKTIPSAR